MRGNYSFQSVKFTGLLLCFTLCLSLGFSRSSFAQSVMKNLESGEILSTTSGNSILLVGLIQRPFEDVKSYLSGKTMAEGLTSLAFAKGLYTQDQKPLLYLKVKGLLDGTGLLMEMKDVNFQAKEALAPLFESAPILEMSLAQLSPSQIYVPSINSWLTQLQTEMREASLSSEVMRSLGDAGKVFSLALAGPLNSPMSLAGVSLQVKLDIRSYEAQSKDSVGKDHLVDYFPSLKTPNKKIEWTYLGAEVSFFPAPVKEELGDYKGFGQRQLSAAKWGGLSLLQDLRSTIESF